MINKIKLLHSTSKRARFYCDFLEEENLNIDSLTNFLQENLIIEDIRINKSAKSIIVSSSSLNILETLDCLENIDITNFLVCDTFLNDCKSCINEEEPTLKPLIQAGTALITTPFVPNDTAKLLLTSYAVSPLLISGAKELFEEGLTSKVLEATAVGVSLARKDYLAANSTNVMLELGEYIEETTVHRSDDLIKELAKPNVEETWMEVDVDGVKQEKLVKTASLNIGDIIIVNAGDTIAIDGHIVSGTAMVNQVSMTGEAAAVKKERGDRVISGTVVEEGKIKVWAEHVGENTATARIKNYIKSSLDEKSAIGLKATKLADKLVPLTLGLAGLSYIISRDVENLASVLQADYSCALKLATPVAFKSSISQAGKAGMMIKGAKSIEHLSMADTFVFDKTGTLTHGELEVESINVFDKNWDEHSVLNLTASAEEHYFHPVAEAVVKAAKNKGFVHMHHDEVEFIVAHGVKTVVNDKEVVIGSRHFLEDDEEIDFKPYQEEISDMIKQGKTILYIGYDKKLLATITMNDTVRENTKTTIKKLKELGVKEIVMLTGDVEFKAKELADEVGVDKVYANMLPTDKSLVIKNLRDEGKNVAFIGDGINDAPALMSANVGISMFRGADIAKATADIGLLKDDIYAIAQLKELANKTMHRIERNFNATVGINTMILAGATFGLIKPITTAFLHNGTTIGLLLSSMQKIKLNKE